MKNDEIKKSIESFLEFALPDGASNTQKNEVEKAHVAGMVAGFSLLYKLPENEAEAMVALNSYREQLDVEKNRLFSLNGLNS